MLYNASKTEGLFRSGFMESGTALPSGYLDKDCLQSKYDGVFTDTGCSKSNNTLQCLRQVPFNI